MEKWPRPRLSRENKEMTYHVEPKTKKACQRGPIKKKKNKNLQTAKSGTISAINNEIELDTRSMK